MRDLLRFARARLNEEHLPQVASSLTFTTVLALVPLLTIALAIFTAFPLFATLRSALEAYFTQSLMPRAIANTILSYMTQFAAKSTGLSAIGGVALLITAVAMMSTIDQVFNRIWGVQQTRPLLQRVLIYWAILTLGPLLIGISISVTSYLFTATNGVVSKIPFFGALAYTAVSILLTTGAFTLLYMTVPNRVINWRDAIWGGLLASVAFEIAKRVFATYIVQFPTYTMVYGSVAVVPIFLVWIYMFWMITLAGALLAAALPVVKHERWWHVAHPGSAFLDAMAILKVLVRARTIGHTAAVDARMIRHSTRLGFDESEKLLQQMLQAGWVGRIHGEQRKRRPWSRTGSDHRDHWALLISPQQLTLAAVYRLFVFAADGNNVAVARLVEHAVEQGLGQTVAAYFDLEATEAIKKTFAPSASANT